MAKKLKVQVIVSGYVSELIARLHNEYPHTERSGIARVERREGHYLVTDIRFPKQSNKGAETELKNGGLESLLEDIFNTNPEQLGEWKCRVHSHHTMGVFRSGTDAAAKASFNDGQQDYRWSIVTAYKEDKVTYKCALNVFKPTEIEFDVPIKAEDFDPSLYFKEAETYSKAYTKLVTDRDTQLAIAAEPYVPTPEDITKLLAIFNVEDDEDNRASCLEILEKNNKSKTKGNTKNINAMFNMEVVELQSFFEGDMFSSKIKELKDNIESEYAYPAPQQFGQVRHYAMGDGDYPNPIAGQQPLFAADLGSKPDKTKDSLNQQQREDDRAEYYGR